MTTAHRPLTKLGRSRLLMAAVLTAMVASLTVGLPGSAGADPCTTGTPEANFTADTVEVSKVEGDDGPTTFGFTIELSCEPSEDVKVDWATVDGTADGDDPDTTETVEGDDYTSASGTETFPALMETPQNFEVSVAGDTDIEADETFTVELSIPEEDTTGATVGDDGVATATIVNDDVYVSVTDATVTEGQPGGFRISLTDDAGDPVTSPHPITIDYTVSASGHNNPAEDPADYSIQSPNPIELQDDSDALISFTTTDDGDAEKDETFTLSLEEPTNAVLAGDGVATGTIVDDEPRVWISDVTQLEGHSGFTHFVFEVHVDPPADEKVVVDYATVDDTAEAKTDSDDTDFDYLETSDQLTFPAGSDETKTITVKVKGDTSAEVDGQVGQVDETFAVELSWPDAETAPNVSLDDLGVGTIVGDDNPTVNIKDSGVAEGADGETSTLGIPVKLVDDDEDDPQPLPAGKDIVLKYWTTQEDEDEATPDGDDVDNPDYQPIAEDPPVTVTIPAGETTGTLPVTVFGDDVEEDDETFTVTIDEPADNSNPDLTIDDDADTAVGTIEDDDGAPTITIGDADKVEGHNSTATRQMVFTVRLSHPSDFDVTFDFNTDNGTAQDQHADRDYQSRVETDWEIPAGETETSIPIDIFGDTKPEANETFVVELDSAVNGEFPDGTSQTTGTGTIINDDGPGVSVGDVSVDEGDSGTRDAVFEITADTTDHDGFTVDVATADGTATAGSDYTARPTETLEFDAGESSATVAVPVRGDTDHEDDETFTLNLSNANFAVVADGEGAATVVNDDEAPADDGGGDGSGDGGDDGGTGDDGPDLGDVTRSAGATRIETALQVSRDHWDQAPDVVLANAATFPDALAGGTLSALLDAPLLLTFTDDLSDGVADELDRLGAQTVWILGGPVAVSVEIQQQLLDAGYEVHRFFGEDRFATAAEIARGTGPSQAGEVVLALGAHDDPDRAWPDALSAGALAAVPDPLPVLLTTTDSLPDATTSALSDLQATTVYLLGGTAAISEDVESDLTGLGYEVVRLAGSSRWGTSVAVATEALRRHGDTDAEDVVFATGQNFPDGLAAGALAARLDGLLLLVPTDQLADETAEFLAAHALRLDRGVIVGGEQAVTATVADEVAAGLIDGG